MRRSSGIGDDHIAFAIRLAVAARGVLARRDRSELDVEVKPDRSFVTRMDRLIETEMRAMIRAVYPTHGIIGEEEADENPGSSHVWVLDPIDGTAPFILGIPVYGTLIALAVDGVPHLGVIDVPGVGGRWLGVTGQATTLNGAPVRCRDCAGLSQALMTNSNQDYMSAAELPALNALRRVTSNRVYGGACLNYGRLAEGRSDLGIDAGQKVFDFAPFRPVIEGAGGVISDWEGQPLTLQSDGRILAAGDRRCHDEALALIAGLGIGQE
ncbi:inositol monophosphatase family protein [Roseovarius autotrophicus]|uniref:inositol monophosphatase family protein n=1 Tax=Roseovarius autotrophicus TaxID=2824121 RepID=UPI0019EE197F|nr:inositol monophosphatase family protein [Roseovarius autotrophicus]MBE0455861.1 inositol monophosphatase [Roseovarius sp.]